MLARVLAAASLWAVHQSHSPPPRVAHPESLKDFKASVVELKALLVALACNYYNHPLLRRSLNSMFEVASKTHLIHEALIQTAQTFATTASLNSPFFSSLEETTECPSIPGLQDIHLILKTGATESLRKLPIHFNTTLRCIPYFTIFSDYEEVISGFQVHDVFQGVDDNIKNTHPEFRLYNNLRDLGRAGLLGWNVVDQESTPSGKPNNPAWVLDKWKFLPMMHETLKFRADAKWYIFMEADTYILWPNLFAWLDKFNASKPYYLGAPMEDSDGVIFAHGGAGYILSYPALRTLTDYHSTRVEEWDKFTSAHWAGDIVLASALQKAGIDLHGSWPMLQNTKPWNFDYFTSFNEEPWCYPPVTYHHMDPEDIQVVWEFERKWHSENENQFILHRDVFQELVQPGYSNFKQDWDNSSDDIVKGVQSAAQCAAQCAQEAECVQYSYKNSICRTSKLLKLGARVPGAVSGWAAERIDQRLTQKGPCEQIKWIDPQ
ncbi:hypothetical protein ACJ72_01146 [Emergomyces africanus]|uniref:N-acetylgalactosaminide beta-1,3-galactosyltransferase n=1 Tax=Emergomyces africanus TaxID=1955775 RepID=A0A1B7P619_9EURO|nr:hypothetical protein ACJ72_01146 [Emergomyces africanus]